MDQDFLIKEHTQLASQKEARQFLNRREHKPLWREYLETAIVAVLAAVLLRMFVLSAYRVNSGSMADTLLEGDYIFVNKLAYTYGGKLPQAGDIIVFKYPNNPDKDFIKRVIAVPGQTVQIADKIVYVDGEVAPVPEGVTHVDKKTIPGDLSFRDNFGPFTVPTNEYFVLGDNRDDSRDSRFWGTVPLHNVLGKAVLVYYSWEPDKDAPGWKFPYVIETVQWIGYGLFNFPSHTRFDRIGTTIP
jgi:signal peptidase I